MAPPRPTSLPLDFVMEDDNWRLYCNPLPVYWAPIPFSTKDVATVDVSSFIGQSLQVITLTIGASHINNLSRKVVVQLLVIFASRFEWKMDMQPDFPINCEVCFGLPSPHHCCCVPWGPAADSVFMGEFLISDFDFVTVLIWIWFWRCCNSYWFKTKYWL